MEVFPGLPFLPHYLEGSGGGGVWWQAVFWKKKKRKRVERLEIVS